jgi:hypothetical protein
VLHPDNVVVLNDTGIMPALLQEIVSVYPLLSPPNLTAHVSNRVCNALALLQCVASHPDTRQLFLNGGFCAWVVWVGFGLTFWFSMTAHIPLFLYPFLNTTSKTRPFVYIRLTSLGVIGALVKVRFFPSLIPLTPHIPLQSQYHFQSQMRNLNVTSLSKTTTIQSSTSSFQPKSSPSVSA